MQHATSVPLQHTPKPRRQRSNGELNKLSHEDRLAHDWYRFVLSYPPHLVRDYLEKFHVTPHQRVLDPFCGTGTTMVECKKLGIPSVGIDRRGAQYVFPVQAKGGTDKLNIVQIEQDFAVCAQKFPDLICRAIAAQFMEDAVIVLFSFEISEDGVALTDEKHYRLVDPDEVSAEDLQAYRQRSFTD
jgi:hypothetical protein